MHRVTFARHADQAGARDTDSALDVAIKGRLHIQAGRLGSSPQESVMRGVRGKRADETMEAALKLQAEGHTKMVVVR